MNQNDDINGVNNTPITPSMGENIEPNPQPSVVAPSSDAGIPQPEVVSPTAEAPVAPMPEAAQPVSNESGSLPAEPKKKSAAPIIIAVVVVALLAVGGFFAYKMFAGNPFEKAIETGFKEFKSNPMVSKPFKATTTMSFDSSEEQLAFLKDFKLNTTVSRDSNNNILMNLGMKESNKDLLDLSVYYTTNKIFFKSPKLINNTYYYTIEASNTTNIKTEDVTYLVNKYEQAIKNAFNGQKLNKEDKSYTINGKAETFKNNYYLIDKNNVKTITEKFVATFEDAETIKKLASILGMEENDVKETLKELKDVDTDDVEPVKIGILTKGLFNKVAGFVLSENNKDMFYFATDGKNGVGKIDMEDNNYVDIVQKDNVYDLTINAEGQKAGAITITVVSDNEVKAVLDFEGMKITIENKIVETSTSETFDTNNAVDISNMSEADMQTMYTNLTNIMSESKTFAALSGLISSFVGGGSEENAIMYEN